MLSGRAAFRPTRTQAAVSSFAISAFCEDERAANLAAIKYGRRVFFCFEIAPR
jgi:hypothetical protein